MMAYLVMMAPRLQQLHRVLKPTGSIYLHCDPTASHYLKLLIDAVFSPEMYRSEIIWKRTSDHGNASRNFAAVHDVLFLYSKTTVTTQSARRDLLPASRQIRLNLADGPIVQAMLAQSR